MQREPECGGWVHGWNDPRGRGNQSQAVPLLKTSLIKSLVHSLIHSVILEEGIL